MTEILTARETHKEVQPAIEGTFCTLVFHRSSASHYIKRIYDPPLRRLVYLSPLINHSVARTP